MFDIDGEEFKMLDYFLGMLLFIGYLNNFLCCVWEDENNEK